MSAPAIIKGQDCCQPCSTTTTVQVPGPAGSAGAAGNNGTNGVNAYTTTTAQFTAPAIGSNVTVTVANSTWLSVGQVIYISTAGYYSVQAVTDSTHISAKNLGYTGNAAPTTVIATSQTLSAGGLKGTDGSAPSTTLNALSPTTTKGDIIVDNGANSPSASDVRLAVGTNGKALVADSTQATGLRYGTITPNTVTNDNNIPRFDGTSGTPMPLQDSKLLITDDGAVQSTPTGGNARGSMAVDLQVSRSAATQVASGARSAILSGQNNTASGDESVVGGGNTNVANSADSGVCCGINNTASAADAFVGGGFGNTASGLDSVVAAGNSNAASGSSTFVGGGSGNTASQSNAVIGGGSGNTASGIDSSILGGGSNIAAATNCAIIGGYGASATLYGQISNAAGIFALAGDAQTSILLARRATTDATPSLLFLDGASARLVIPNNKMWGFRGQVVGRTSAGVCAVYDVEGGIKNNAGTTTLIGTATVTLLVSDGGWPGGAAVAITADAVNNALSITVTGAAATLIRWLGNLRLTEVAY